jgi:hypothetical protein
MLDDRGLRRLRIFDEAEYADHFAEQHARAVKKLDDTEDPFEAENAAAKAAYDTRQANLIVDDIS